MKKTETAIGSWRAYHADDDQEWIGLIQWKRQTEAPYGQTEVGHITFPVDLAPKVIAALAQQLAKSEDTDCYCSDTGCYPELSEHCPKLDGDVMK